jgi:autophagy-related protein 17
VHYPHNALELKSTIRVKDWDILRAQHTDALDKILESLGSQVVPPDFHQASSSSSLFGSQLSDEEAQGNGRAASTLPFEQSPTATLRIDLHGKRVKLLSDRTSWKTLRDFVDDRAIDDALEAMESDRSALDVCVPVVHGWLAY